MYLGTFVIRKVYKLYSKTIGILILIIDLRDLSYDKTKKN